MCTFHFEEFALYGANRSLFQTSVETPKSLFLIPPSEERKYFAKSFRNLSAIGDTVGRWSLSGKIAEKEVLKKHKQQKNFFRGQEGFKRWGITLQYFKENWSSGPFSAEVRPDYYYIITYIILSNNIWTVPNCSFPRLGWGRFVTSSLTPCSPIRDCRTPQFTEPFSPEGLLLVFFCDAESQRQAKWLQQERHVGSEELVGLLQCRSYLRQHDLSSSIVSGK